MDNQRMETFLQTKGEICIDTIPNNLLEYDNGNWRKRQNPNKFTGDMNGSVIGKQLNWAEFHDIYNAKMEDKVRRTSVVYLAYCNGYYKIGRSKRPRKRIQEMKTGNPYKIELFDVIEDISGTLLEKELHRDLTPYRKRGEWFNLEIDDALHRINSILEHYELDKRYKLVEGKGASPKISIVNKDTLKSIQDKSQNKGWKSYLS